MFATYAEKLAGLFDRRFLLAYWAPVVASGALVASVIAAYTDPPAFITAVATLNLTSQFVLSLGLLIASVVGAFILEALTSPIVRFYEGYNWPRWLFDWGRDGQLKRWDSIFGELSAGDLTRYAEFYFRFPQRREKVLSTRLGNLLRAAEDYAMEMYFIDSIIWWPRLATLLPDPFSARIDAAITPVYALLNLATLSIAVALAGGVSLLIVGSNYGLFLGTFLGGLLLARLCYYAALSPAGGYGNLVRVAFDFYRGEILKQMRIELPPDRTSERMLWEHLTQRVYAYEPGADLVWPPALDRAAPVFRFKTDAAPPPAPTQRTQLLQISIRGLPKITVTREFVPGA
jgi:hypothetical protein